MFVIVASSAKSDIESKECVCLTKVDKIETYFNKNTSYIRIIRRKE